MTKAANIDAIEEATKLAWSEWVKYLDELGAKELKHREIADLVYAKLQNEIDSAGWWSQGVTVAYEQHVGRRQPGQRSDGTFEVAVSKTLDASMDETIAKWIGLVAGKADFDGVKIAKEPTTSQAEKSRHWGCNLEDGTRVNTDTYPKSAGKTIFTITHIRLDSREAADRWRAYWKIFIEEMSS